MKLLRHGPRGAEKPGLLHVDGTIRDLSGVIPDIVPATLAPASLDRLRALNPSSLPAVDGHPAPRRAGERRAEIRSDRPQLRGPRARVEPADPVPSRSSSTRRSPRSTVRTTTSCCRATAPRPIGRSSSAW